jgi:hypothetical protein
MKPVFPILLYVISLNVFGQSFVSLNFIPMWQGTTISVDSVFSIVNSGDSLRVTALRFYVYNIQLESENRVVWNSGEEHFLIDVFEKDGTSLPTKLPTKSTVDHLSFIIGVDSTLQTNGAHSGVLDPIHGMYWSWQSGYINWKLEAEVIHAGQSNAIQWHVGGYHAPYQTQRTVRLKVMDDADSIQCGLQLDSLLRDWRVIAPAEVMSPSDKAMVLSDRFQSCFHIVSH